VNTQFKQQNKGFRERMPSSSHIEAMPKAHVPSSVKGFVGLLDGKRPQLLTALETISQFSIWRRGFRLDNFSSTNVNLLLCLILRDLNIEFLLSGVFHSGPIFFQPLLCVFAVKGYWSRRLKMQQIRSIHET